MKKSLILALTAITMGVSSPLVSLADSIDDKIQAADNKIDAIAKDKAEADAYLGSLESDISQLEAEYEATLAEKVSNEKKLNKINDKVSVLKEKIEKRKVQIEKQARNAQLNSNESPLIYILTNSESLTDAITKGLAMTKLVSTNNDVMATQKKDKEKLVVLQNEMAEKIEVITEKTTELAANKESLLEAKLEQAVKINEIGAALATEKAEKSKFVKEKKKAEARRKAELKRLAEEKKLQEKLQKQAEEEQARQAEIAKEQAQKEQAAQIKAEQEARAKAEQEQAAKEQAQKEKDAQQVIEETQVTEATTETQEETQVTEATTETQEETQVTEATTETQEETQVTEATTETQEETVTETEVVEQTQEEPQPEAEKEEVATLPATGSGWSSPLSGALIVTSPFGYRQDPNGVSGNGHDGIDLAGSHGTPILAAKSGTVAQSGFDPSAGNYIIIDHGDGYYSYYMHMSSLIAGAGQSVSTGQTIGLMGTTGNSTGVHLHFGVATGIWSGFVNPAPLLGI
ncbi:peptidoglycan DD-metalloendopeptidase family protein [Vagococcus fessus]|uniref:peptidoglycan DD-metalloendopeptidase family protein n=1 Tax=Vagococcus fessus TaxID=120370 RepID=UPI0039EA58C3